MKPLNESNIDNLRSYLLEFELGQLTPILENKLASAYLAIALILFVDANTDKDFRVLGKRGKFADARLCEIVDQMEL